MPPLKEYEFENIYNTNVFIHINAYSFEGSMNILVSITKNPGDYKLISN